MSKTSTTEKLVLYLFNETGMTESVLIQREIDNDEEVEIEFSNIKRVFRYVDRALIDPSPKCIANIMQYAMNTAVKVN